MPSFKSFLRESLAQQAGELLATKNVRPTQERSIQRMILRNNSVELKNAFAWLQKQPNARNEKEYATFERLWEKVPSYWHGYAKPGEGVQASLSRFHLETAVYFRQHFGGSRV